MTTLTFDTALVKAMLEEAISYSARTAGLAGREQVLEALHRGECAVCEPIRYGMAKGVAKYLASVDDTVKAVYVFEPEYATSTDTPIAGRPNFSPGINLIAWVSRKSAALSSVVAAVGSALAEELGQLACSKANALCYGLDVKMVDDDEVQRRTGYGALISSLYVRPIEIWHR